MTDDRSTIEHEAIPPAGQAPSARGRSIGLVAGIAGIALLAVGAVAGAGASRIMGNHEAQPLMPAVAITSISDGNVVAVKGTVAEIYGNKFVVQDASGRALIETGPRGDGGKLVAKDETVTVQGRFEDGFIHGSMIVHPDGKTDLIGPAGGPPHHGPKDWLRRP